MTPPMAVKKWFSAALAAASSLQVWCPAQLGAVPTGQAEASASPIGSHMASAGEVRYRLTTAVTHARYDSGCRPRPSESEGRLYTSA